jgi:UDP-N-acetylglucosamine 2-epimerase (non-hydrolysing)
LSQKFKVTTILGTRPELIRLSSIIDGFDRIFDHRLIHTGQNSDVNLSEIFFKELNIRTPNKFISVKSDSLGVFLGKLLFFFWRKIFVFFGEFFIISTYKFYSSFIS